MIAEKRYSGEDANEKEVRRCRKVFRELFRLRGLFVVGDAIPFLGWLDFGGHVKDMRRTTREMDNLITRWLEEHHQERDSGEPKTEHDFINVMMSILDRADLASYDADTVNKATCSIIELTQMIVVGRPQKTLHLNWISILVWWSFLLMAYTLQVMPPSTYPSFQASQQQ